MNIKINFGASYGSSGLEYFKLIPEINTEESLEIFVDGEINLNKSQKLGTIFFKKMFFTIGLVPVYITPQLDIYIGFDGKITAKINTGIEFKQQLRAGVVYNKREGIKMISSLNNPSWNFNLNISWNFNKPKLETSLDSKTFIKPELSVKLYGVTGPSIMVRTYLKLKSNKLFAKNYKCFYTAWMGIDSEIKWNIDDSTGDSKFRILKREWAITPWNTGENCN
jgi:hypothetical protein